MDDLPFGLTARPFVNVPDPAYFLSEGQYGHILDTLVDAVLAGQGLSIISGPIGSGKTTLSQKLISLLPPTTTLIWLAEPPASAKELFDFIAHDLGLASASSRAFILRDIKERLHQRRAINSTCLLVIDESHHMSEEVLEGVRILTNLELWSAKLLQIVLIGQPELMDQLQSERMEPLRQRVAVLKTLDRMDSDETKRYIRHRLRVAGARREVFSPAAMELIAHTAGGIPRLVNNICQMSLRLASEGHKPLVDVEDVRAASIELGLGGRSIEYLRWQRENSTRQQTASADMVLPPPANGPEPTDERQPAAAPETTSLPSAPAIAPPQMEIPFETRRTSALRQRKSRRHLAVLFLSFTIFVGSLLFYLQRLGKLPSW